VGVEVVLLGIERSVRSGFNENGRLVGKSVESGLNENGRLIVKSVGLGVLISAPMPVTQGNKNFNDGQGLGLLAIVICISDSERWISGCMPHA